MKNYAPMNSQGLDDNMDSSLEISSPVKTHAQRRNNSQKLVSQVEMMTGMNVDNAGLMAFENGRDVAAVDCAGENGVADNYSGDAVMMVQQYNDNLKQKILDLENKKKLLTMKDEKICLEEKLFELQRGVDDNGANMTIRASTRNVPRSVCGGTVDGSSFQGNENGQILTVLRTSHKTMVWDKMMSLYKL